MPTSEVYNEDCMMGMVRYPDNFFDLAIVDPPYGLSLDFCTANGLRESIHEDKDWNKAIPTEDYFIELHRVSKHQIIWGCNYFAKYIPAVGRIIHDKDMHIDGSKINFSEADIASCSLQNRVTMFRYAWNGNRQGKAINWNNSGPDARVHPTQKPLFLYNYCLRYAKPAWKILDTHMGSQSSRIAAYNLGFDFWGWELDNEYYEVGDKRFKRQTSQIQIF
jgi:site-specific DNA-methyltransferase (adenine-specific)